MSGPTTNTIICLKQKKSTGKQARNSQATQRMIINTTIRKKLFAGATQLSSCR